MKGVAELCRDCRHDKRLYEISEHTYSGSSISLAARMDHEVIGRRGSGQGSAKDVHRLERLIFSPGTNVQHSLDNVLTTDRQLALK